MTNLYVDYGGLPFSAHPACI